MGEFQPRFLEWTIFCREKDRPVLYRLYAELTSVDRKLWSGEQNFRQLELMKRRTGILTILPRDVMLVGSGLGKLIDYDISTLVKKAAQVYTADGRRAWVVRHFERRIDDDESVSERLPAKFSWEQGAPMG